MNQQLNYSRQVPLDLARGLSVLFMVAIHVQEYFLNRDLAQEDLALVIDFLGGIPAAPVFMFLMGVGWVYSKRSTPSLLLRRGLSLLGLGYALSFFRGVLPNFLHYATSREAYYIWQGLEHLAFIDILQFSGLAMMAFAYIKHRKMGPRGIALLAGLIMGLNALLAYGLGWVTFGIDGGPQDAYDLVLGHLTGLLYGANNLSFFPFLTWMVYPLWGYLFGYGLVRASNQKRYYLLAAGLGLMGFLGVTFLVDWVLEWDNQLYSYTGYYHHQAFENLIAVSFVLAFIGLCYGLAHFLPQGVQGPILHWSTHVTSIYFSHWVMLGWLAAFMGYNTLSSPYYLALFILVMGVSHQMAHKPKSKA